MSVYTDAFTGTEVSPPPGWTANTGTNFTYTPKRYGNKFTGPGGGGAAAAHYSGAAFADNQYSKATIGGVGASSVHYVLVRAAASGATFYGLRCAGGNTIGLRKVVAGTITTLGVDQSVSYANGDVLELRVEGTTLTGYRNGAAIASVTATDSSSPLTSGSAGLGATDQSYTWDDWEGGDIVAAEGAGVERVFPESTVLELELSAGAWTDVTSDVVGPDHIRIRYGIQGNTPADRVASTGTLAFTLKNGPTNSAGLLGYYSPNHSNCRVGFQFGIGARVRITFLGVTYTKFHGRLTTIDPLPGQYQDRKTRCVATDWMEEAAVTDLRDITPQLNQTADALVTAVLAAMPATSQPVATDLDVCTDNFPYTFDKLGGGPVYALSVLNEIVQSEAGYLYVAGGTLVLQNRAARSGEVDVFGFSDNMTGLSAPSTLDNVYNVVRVTTHPRTVDNAAVVLCTFVGTPAIGPGEVATFWLDYKDPNHPDTYIGGTDFVDPVATTDFTANAAADGSGANLTGFLTVTATGFAASVQFEITNGSGSTAYLTKLQYRGKGIYDLQPVTYEARRTQSYGERRIEVDLPYQGSAVIAQGLADYLVDIYQWPGQSINWVEFLANMSNAALDSALRCEPGSRITVAESMIGLTGAVAFVQSVDLDLAPGGLVGCRWGLAPAHWSHYWVLGDAVQGQLDVTTRLGYV